MITYTLLKPLLQKARPRSGHRWVLGLQFGFLFLFHCLGVNLKVRKYESNNQSTRSHKLDMAGDIFARHLDCRHSSPLTLSWPLLLFDSSSNLFIARRSGRKFKLIHTLNHSCKCILVEKRVQTELKWLQVKYRL